MYALLQTLLHSVWEFSAFCSCTHSSACVCVCVLLCPVWQFPAPAGGLEEHQEAKLCAAGNVMCMQGPLREAPHPQAATHCPCLCHSLCPPLLSGICTRVTDDSMMQLIWPRGERSSTTCDELFFRPQLRLIPVQERNLDQLADWWRHLV